MTDAKRQALAAAKRATDSLDAATRRREAAIRAAAEVASLREIAEATGLSKPRVQQIVRPRPGVDRPATA